jgi:DNA-binding IscR family transcriptional regulator
MLLYSNSSQANIVSNLKDEEFVEVRRRPKGGWREETKGKESRLVDWWLLSELALIIAFS